MCKKRLHRPLAKRNIVQQLRMVSLSLENKDAEPLTSHMHCTQLSNTLNIKTPKTLCVKCILLAWQTSFQLTCHREPKQRSSCRSWNVNIMLSYNFSQQHFYMNGAAGLYWCVHSLLKPLVESQRHIILLLQSCHCRVHLGGDRVQVYVQLPYQSHELLYTAKVRKILVRGNFHLHKNSTRKP